MGTGGNALVTALDSRTGALRWQRRLHPGNLFGSDLNCLAADATGGLYGGTEPGAAFALDQATGAVRWSIDVGGSAEAGVSRAPNAVLVPVYEVGLVALAPADGARLWTYSHSSYTGWTPASGGGVAYMTSPLGDGGSSIRAVSLTDGGELASMDLPIATGLGPAISRGRLYAAGINRVFCLGLPG